MKTWYRVTTTFDNRGRVKAFVDSVKASAKPEGTFHSGRRFDTYEDYFNTETEARTFAEEAKNA